MKKILEYIFKKTAQSVLAKYDPEIIAITGSLGKASAKMAIYAVLKNKFKIRSSIKNYNNEFDLFLTILGIKQAPGKSLIRWLRILSHALSLLILNHKEYPKIFILEMCPDKPGNLKHLIQIVKPNIGVFTSIKPRHFKNEKTVLIKALLKQGLAVLNFDDFRVRALQKASRANVLFYGFNSKADVWASDLNFHVQKKKNYLAFKLNYQGKSIPFYLKNISARDQVYPCLAAVCIGLHYKMNLLEISQALERWPRLDKRFARC